MTGDRFEAFLAQCVAAAQEKNDALEREFGLGSYARWDAKGDLGVIIFSNPGEARRVEARTFEVGSYSLKTQTWLWGWANESHSMEERERSVVLRELAERTGNRVFGDATGPCDEFLAWELTAAAVEHLGAEGCYRGPVGHLWVFWALTDVRFVE